MAPEVKSFIVSPRNEAETIERYQSFGWQLFSSKEIYDAHNCKRLTFKREIDTENYKELVELEKQYEKIVSPPKKSAKKFFIFGGILTGIGFFSILFCYYCFGLNDLYDFFFIFPSLCLSIGLNLIFAGIIFKIITSIIYKKRYKNSSHTRKKILERAKKLREMA